jgi:predicted metal-dependent peptidase
VASLTAYQPHGGGGTDMRLGISAALTIVPRPRTIIVLTDGDTPWPASAPPGVNLVTVLVPNEGSDKVADHTISRVPPFITTIVAEPPAVRR